MHIYRLYSGCMERYLSTCMLCLERLQNEGLGSSRENDQRN